LFGLGLLAGIGVPICVGEEPGHPALEALTLALADAAVRPSAAIPLARAALTEAEKSFGSAALPTAEAINRLALLLYDTGNYGEAEALLAKVLRIREGKLAPNSPPVLDAVDALALFYHDTGAAALAAPLLQRSINAHQDPLETPQATAHLSPAMAPGKDEDPIFRKAMFPERLLQARLPDLLKSRSDPAAELAARAWIRLAHADDNAARQLFLRALALREKEPNHEQPATARLLNGLALSERFYQADGLLGRALHICETTRGAEHPDTASTLHNHALLYFKLGFFAEAEPFFERAAAIRLKSLGPDHPDYLICLHNLGLLDETTGNYAKAKECYEKAVGVAERNGSLSHVNSDPLLARLGLLYVNLGDAASAKALFAKALLLRTGRPAADTDGMHHLMEWVDHLIKDPVSHTERGVSSVPGIAGMTRRFDPNSVADCNATALRQLQSGQAAEALQMATRAVDLREKHDRHLNSSSHEVNWIYNDIRVDSDSGSDERFAMPCTLGDPALIARTLLHEKTAAYDSLDEGRQIAKVGGEAMAEDLQASQRKLRYFDLNHPPAEAQQAGRQLWSASSDEARTDLWLSEQRLEAATGITLHKKRRALEVTLEQVQSKLKSGRILLEFVRYKHFVNSEASEARYGALVIAASGSPTWVSLATTAEALDQEMVRYQQATENVSITNSAMSKLLANLYQHVWAPLEPLFPADTTSVIISPDSQLNFLSFATLLTPDGKFLAQKYLLNYVSSGRDLLASSSAPTNRNLCVVAAPEFDLALPLRPAGDEPDRLASRAAQQFNPWHALPGAKIEGEVLAKNAARWGWPPATLIQGAAATKSAVTHLQHPWILHLATHGFFWNPATKSNALPELAPNSPFAAILTNPMYRSGIACAGANTTLSQWKQGQVPPVENDGILLAAEAAEMDLHGTWLVVLSACQTGMGESRSGAGVLGLRSAFLQAGAQHLLLTLWQIDDRFTSSLMTQFYAELVRGGDPADALARVQRAELLDLGAREGLVSAVQKAGPFVLNGAP